MCVCVCVCVIYNQLFLNHLWNCVSKLVSRIAWLYLSWDSTRSDTGMRLKMKAASFKKVYFRFGQTESVEMWRHWVLEHTKTCLRYGGARFQLCMLWYWLADCLFSWTISFSVFAGWNWVVPSTVALYRPAVKEESAYHQFCSSSIKRIKFVKYHRATAVSDSPMHRSDDEGKFRGWAAW